MKTKMNAKMYMEKKKLVSASHKHLRRESYHARKILELIDYSEADK